VAIRFDVVSIGATRVDAMGGLVPVAVPIPPGAAAGVHTITAEGASGEAAQAPFTVQTALQGRFALGSFVPSALRSRLRFAVYLPPRYGDGRRYPVIYFLSGLPQGAFAYRSWLLFGANAFEPGGERAIIVSVQAARSSDPDGEYHDWGPGHDWETVIGVQLPRLIDARYSTIANRSGRALVGASAGGYGAMLIGLHHLGMFAVIESWSGYYQPTDPTGQTRISVGSAEADAKADAFAYVPGLPKRLARFPTWIGFYVGDDDSLFRNDNLAYDAALTRTGVPHRFALYPGAHGQTLWQQHAADWLTTAAAHLAQAR
jgi:enterochelin esterase-like enzyme